MYVRVGVGGWGSSAQLITWQKQKTQKTGQENRKVDAQFVLGAPMTRCACGCMCWMGESQAPALCGRACDVSGQRENKRGGQGERLGGAHAQTRLLFSCFTCACPLFALFHSFFFFKSVAGIETGSLSAAMLAQWLRPTLTLFFFFFFSRVKGPC